MTPQDVTSVRFENGGWHYSIMRCECGAELRLYAEAAQFMDMPDFNCDRCNRTYNLSGQYLQFPRGQGEDYAGERWDEDY